MNQESVLKAEADLKKAQFNHLMAKILFGGTMITMVALAAFIALTTSGDFEFFLHVLTGIFGVMGIMFTAGLVINTKHALIDEEFRFGLESLRQDKARAVDLED